HPILFFFSSRRRHTRFSRDWSSDVCSSDLGMLGKVAHTWRQRPELRTAELHERLLRLWVEQEAFRLAGIRLRQQLAAGEPGPEGSGMKLAFARLAQQLSGLELELLGEEG